MRSTRFLVAMAIAAVVLSSADAARPEEETGESPAPVLAADALGTLRYALVIGIDDYADAGIPDLPNSEANARGVLSVLADPHTGGVPKANTQSLFGVEATAAKIRAALEQLGRVPKEATVFVYFSGHGAAKGEDAYWLAQDSREERLSKTTLGAGEVRRLLDDIPAERVLLLMECRHAPDLVGKKKARVDHAGVLSRYHGAGHATLAVAGSEEHAIASGEVERSVFTHHLMVGLSGEADDDWNGVVDLGELAEDLARRVKVESRKRRGLERAVVDLEGMKEPSHLLLTIHPAAFAERLMEEKSTWARRGERLAGLSALLGEGRISEEQERIGRHWIGSLEEGFGTRELEQRAMFVDVVEGRLGSKHLADALTAIRRADRRTLVVPDEFETIQAAIDAAAAGDTVFVKAGRYEERVALKTGLHLRGEGRERTVLAIVPGQVEILLAEDCAWGAVERLQFDGTGGETVGDWRPDGLHLERSSLRIHECLVHSLLGCGLYANGVGSTPTVRACTIEQNGQDGVLFQDTDGGTIAGCICRSNGKVGIQIRKCRGTVAVRDCLCELDKEAGIGVCGGSAAHLEVNTCRGNGGHGVIGWEKGTKVTLEGNTCSGNTIYGVYLVQRAEATATDNDCSQNKEGGIVASGLGTRATVMGNRCRENRLSVKGDRGGIVFCGGAEGEATSNTCEDNAWGILVRDAGTSARLLDNKCRHNEVAGIGFSEAAPGHAARNECDENPLGISVSRTEATLQDNTLRHNTMHGISIGKRGSGEASGNRCEENEQVGIHVTDMGTRADLRKNVCTSNGRHGIQYARGAGGTAEDNECDENEGFGVVASDSGTRPTFRKNRCTNNGRAGVGAEEGATPVIASDNVQSGNGP